MENDNTGFDFTTVDDICLQIKEAVKNITITVKESSQMLPRSDDNSNSPIRKNSGLTYLSNEMLTQQPKESTIMAVKSGLGKWGAQIILKLLLNGNVVFWNVTVKSNPNYKLLEGKFGYNESDWKDQSIFLHLEQDDFSGKWYPRVSFSTEKKSKK